MATNYYNINSDNYQDITGSRSISHPKQVFSGTRTFPLADLLYGPYQSKEFAHKFLIRHFDYKNLYDIDTCISKNGGEVGKKIPQGQTVAIIENDETSVHNTHIREYWYRDPMPEGGYTVDNLVPKIGDITWDMLSEALQKRIDNPIVLIPKPTLITSTTQYNYGENIGTEIFIEPNEGYTVNILDKDSNDITSDFKNVGSYTLAITPNEGYRWQDTRTDVSITYSISVTKRQLEKPSVSNITKEWNSEGYNDYELSSEAHGGYTVTIYFGEDNPIDTVPSSGTRPKITDIGEYIIKAELDSDSYIWNDSSSSIVSLTYTITPVHVEKYSDISGYYYNGNVTTISGNNYYSVNITGETITPEYTTDTVTGINTYNLVHADKYSITFSLRDKDHFVWKNTDVTTDDAREFNILKRPVTVKLNETEKFWNDKPFTNGSILTKSDSGNGTYSILSDYDFIESSIQVKLSCTSDSEVNEEGYTFSVNIDFSEATESDYTITKIDGLYKIYKIQVTEPYHSSDFTGLIFDDDNTVKTVTSSDTTVYTVQTTLDGSIIENGVCYLSGDYITTLTLVDPDHYCWVYGSDNPNKAYKSYNVEWSISTKTATAYSNTDSVTVQWDPDKNGYNTPWSSGQGYTVSMSYSEDSTKEWSEKIYDIGTYTLTASLKHGYKWSTGSLDNLTKTIVIERYHVSLPTNGVPVNESELTYGSGKITLIEDTYYTISLTKNTESVSFTNITTNSKKAYQVWTVGSYVSTWSLPDSEHYAWYKDSTKYSEDQNYVVSWEIEKKDMTISFKQPEEKTYTTHSVFSETDFEYIIAPEWCYSEEYSVTLKAPTGTTLDSYIDVGNYSGFSLNIVGDYIDNYNLSIEEATYVIKKKKITVPTLSTFGIDGTYSYDPDVTITLTNTTQAYYTVSTVADRTGEDSENTGNLAGTYTTTVTLSLPKNTSWDDGTDDNTDPVTLSWEIERASNTVVVTSASNLKYDYGDKISLVRSIEGNLTSNSIYFDFGPNPQYTSTNLPTVKNAGTYEVCWYCPADYNYKSQTGSFTVTVDKLNIGELTFVDSTLNADSPTGYVDSEINFTAKSIYSDDTNVVLSYSFSPDSITVSEDSEGNYKYTPTTEGTITVTVSATGTNYSYSDLIKSIEIKSLPVYWFGSNDILYEGNTPTTFAEAMNTDILSEPKSGFTPPVTTNYADGYKLTGTTISDLGWFIIPTDKVSKIKIVNSNQENIEDIFTSTAKTFTDKPEYSICEISYNTEFVNEGTNLYVYYIS